MNDHRPAYEQIERLMKFDGGIEDAAIDQHFYAGQCYLLDRLVDAGLVQPKAEPWYTEDDVRELSMTLGEWTGFDGDPIWEQAIRVLEAGYRKSPLTHNPDNDSPDRETDIAETCPECRGTGVYIGVRDFPGSTDNDGQTMAECPECKGTGKIARQQKPTVDAQEGEGT